MIGIDEGGKPIYTNGHRRCNGVWVCHRPLEAEDGAATVQVGAMMYNMPGPPNSGNYRKVVKSYAGGN